MKANNASASSDIGRKPDVITAVSCVYDIFCVEYITAVSPDLITIVINTELVAGGEVRQSVSFLIQVCAVAVFKIYAGLIRIRGTDIDRTFGR